MGVLSTGALGFDLGSANSTLYLENEGVVLREATCALVNTNDSTDYIAFGRDARAMSGRTPKSVELVMPVKNGAIADCDHAFALINALSDKALGRKRSLEKSKLVITYPHGLTRVEYDAFLSVIKRLNAKRSYIVRTSLAAALGSNVSLGDVAGSMIVSIGAGVTEISVLSMNGIVACRSMRTGSSEFDRAIVRYIRNKKNLVIGMRTAEDLKIDIGTLNESVMTDHHEVILRGRDARTGNPSTTGVTIKEVREAITGPVDSIVEGIREAFENIPPELAGDILERGIQLTGGGCLIEGMAKRIGDMTGLTVRTGEDASADTAVGAGMLASDDKLLSRFITLGSVTAL